MPIILYNIFKILLWGLIYSGLLFTYDQVTAVEFTSELYLDLLGSTAFFEPYINITGNLFVLNFLGWILFLVIFSFLIECWSTIYSDVRVEFFIFFMIHFFGLCWLLVANDIILFF